MPDVVTSQTLNDGPRNAVMVFTNISDGTGESAVLKVDVSALNPNPPYGACTGVTIDSIQYTVIGMSVKILWDADTDVTAVILQGSGFLDFHPVGGLVNNAGTGVTGDIRFTTADDDSGDSYSIVLAMRKKYAT